MAIEIERKFLVTTDAWRAASHEVVPMAQGYLNDLAAMDTGAMKASVREVVGVEGEAGLVQRARENAAHNGIANAQFHAADLAKDLGGQPWMREGFDRLLLDPPRSGADFVLAHLPLKQFKRIVYVSCHPASLARDAGYLVREKGWKLRAAGVMDMFPHTAHVESIAMFEPR